MYWVIRHGIKMSGMPAWEYHLADDDIWATVAFLTKLPTLTPQAYKTQIADAGPAGTADAELRPSAAGLTPDPQRGRVALTQYACQACHMIPGVTGPRVYVGPPLQGIAGRAIIAGRLPNSADSMVRWIRYPQQVDPRTAMPTLGVAEADARDIAAYLQTLH